MYVGPQILSIILFLFMFKLHVLTARYVHVYVQCAQNLP